MSLELKSCPRCKTGDVNHDRDMYGESVYCLQCGYQGAVRPPPVDEIRTAIMWSAGAGATDDAEARRKEARREYDRNRRRKAKA